MKRRDPLGDTLAAIVIVIALVGGIWTWTSAPCGVWAFSKVGDMPARCINQ
ncbi:hypothetical protein SEA_TINABELCHER_33 [Streptomyces phage TinaBelcher]|uniref:Uncharacterized protein n=1 Tax=Streptomyces phage Thestral TaxID=2301715 RepID=A0A385E0F6_9CAUD|nr:hypothetical protein KGG90_gp52 [Streptomyces phage Thestral]AXQ62358.1 hypothetical protein SEA_TRVXSCOTT_32 [Streptomyces phage TrvxScott]AXQ65231.1 hypothetical protein SEA_THESTRAL_34 [Streptomyces phage Thestral]QAY15856.1 hypothetical protein SEA_TINABELCHER_33 [Streptomyces phage TinaBelcher]